MRFHLPALAALALLAPPSLAQYPPSEAFEGSPSMTEFESRLRTNGILYRLQWEVVRSQPGVLLSQKPTRKTDEFVATQTERYAPFLALLGDHLNTTYFSNPELPRKRGDFGYSLFIAENQRTYVGLRREARRPSKDAQAAVTFDDWGLVVAYDRGFTGGRPDSFQRFPVLREVVRETLRQRAETQALVKWPQEPWLMEGFCTWHCYHEGDDPEELLEPRLHPETLAWLEGLAENPAELEAFLVPLDVLRSAEDEKALTLAVNTRAAAAELDKPGVSQVAAVNEHLPNLYFAHYAQTNPDAAAELLREMLAGTCDAGLLDRVVGGDSASRYQDFRLWVESMLTGRSVAVLKTKAPTVKDYATPEVALLPEGTEDWMSLAMGMASTGDYAQAEVFLEVAQEQEDLDQASIAKLRGRLTALRSARDGLLAAVAGTKEKLRLPHDGKKISVAIESVTEESVRFAKNKYDLEEMELKAIPPEALALALGRDAKDYGPGWTVTLARWLSADERWDRSLDEDDPEEMAVAADLEGDWMPLLQAGLVARELDRLARLQPDSIEGAGEIVTTLEAVMRDHAQTPVIRDRREALAQLGARALATSYASKGLESRLHGKVVALPDGRISITYTFDDPDELKDWVPVKDYLPERREEKFEVPLSEEESKWAVKAGNLQGIGRGCFKHGLRWKAPMTLHFDILYGRPEPGQGELGTMLVAICDDGEGSYVGAADIHDLETVEKAGGLMLIEAEQENRSVKSATTYKLALIHDGEGKVTLERDGKTYRSIGTAERRSGNVVLWLHSQMTLAVKQVKIEGWLDTSEVDPGQEAFVDEELRKMGLYR